MREVIFHFPCSICWHGEAAGLCPRSSCISSPGKGFLHAWGQILSRNPAPARIRPKLIQLHLGSSEKRALLLFIASPTLTPKLLAALGSLALRAGRGSTPCSAPLGPARLRSVPLGLARLRSAPSPTAAWNHSAPSWAKAAPPAPRPRNGSARAQRVADLRGGGWNSAAKVTRERSLRGAQSTGSMPWVLQCRFLSFFNANFGFFLEQME